MGPVEELVQLAQHRRLEPPLDRLAVLRVIRSDLRRMQQAMDRILFHLGRLEQASGARRGRPRHK